jgi:hypothetical protein
MNDQTFLYIQRLEAEIADNHAQWRADQQKINYLLSELETYKVAMGAIYEALAPHYEEMGVPH